MLNSPAQTTKFGPPCWGIDIGDSRSGWPSLRRTLKISYGVVERRRFR
jgi:hypothetical protein